MFPIYYHQTHESATDRYFSPRASSCRTSTGNLVTNCGSAPSRLSNASSASPSNNKPSDLCHSEFRIVDKSPAVDLWWVLRRPLKYPSMDEEDTWRMRFGSVHGCPRPRWREMFRKVRRRWWPRCSTCPGTCCSPCSSAPPGPGRPGSPRSTFWTPSLRWCAKNQSHIISPENMVFVFYEIWKSRNIDTKTTANKMNNKCTKIGYSKTQHKQN